MYSRANEMETTTYLHTVGKKVAEDYVCDRSVFMMLRNRQNDILLRDIFTYNKRFFLKEGNGNENIRDDGYLGVRNGIREQHYNWRPWVGR